MTGDLILIANEREQYCFSGAMAGMHGGLLPGESETVLTFAIPGGSPDQAAWMQETISGIVADRCANEGNRQPSVADMLPAALALMGW
jgi:hypothetical protein